MGGKDPKPSPTNEPPTTPHPQNSKSEAAVTSGQDETAGTSGSSVNNSIQSHDGEPDDSRHTGLDDQSDKLWNYADEFPAFSGKILKRKEVSRIAWSNRYNPSTPPSKMGSLKAWQDVSTLRAVREGNQANGMGSESGKHGAVGSSIKSKSDHNRRTDEGSTSGSHPDHLDTRVDGRHQQTIATQHDGSEPSAGCEVDNYPRGWTPWDDTPFSHLIDEIYAASRFGELRQNPNFGQQFGHAPQGVVSSGQECPPPSGVIPDPSTLPSEMSSSNAGQDPTQVGPSNIWIQHTLESNPHQSSFGNLQMPSHNPQERSDLNVALQSMLLRQQQVFRPTHIPYQGHAPQGVVSSQQECPPPSGVITPKTEASQIAWSNRRQADPSTLPSEMSSSNAGQDPSQFGPSNMWIQHPLESNPHQSSFGNLQMPSHDPQERSDLNVALQSMLLRQQQLFRPTHIPYQGPAAQGCVVVDPAQAELNKSVWETWIGRPLEHDIATQSSSLELPHFRLTHLPSAGVLSNAPRQPLGVGCALCGNDLAFDPAGHPSSSVVEKKCGHHFHLSCLMSFYGAFVLSDDFPCNVCEHR